MFTFGLFRIRVFKNSTPMQKKNTVTSYFKISPQVFSKTLFFIFDENVENHAKKIFIGLMKSYGLFSKKLVSCKIPGVQPI